MSRSLSKSNRLCQPIFAVVVLLALSCLLWLLLSYLTETEFFGKTAYCTYTLQAMAWRNGQVSLGQDYPWLELAVYQDDWYVSFPPVPTVPLYLLSFLFGDQIPDNLLVKFYAFMGMWAVFTLLYKKKGILPAAFIAFMTGFCGSVMALSTQGAVWYQAQILALCLILAAILLAFRGRITISLFLFALSVGCRPFHVAYGPLLLFIWWKKQKDRSPRACVNGTWKGITLGLAVAAVYAFYNYIRFGNPLEFGTSYLPEFVRSANGEFSLAHVAGNIKRVIFGLPFEITDSGLSLKQYGFSVFLANPLLLCLLIRFALNIAQRRLSGTKVMCFSLFCAQLFLLLLHRTFGGYQFGARYAVDLIPYSVVYYRLDSKKLSIWEIMLLVIGLIFALYGVSVIHI